MRKLFSVLVLSLVMIFAISFPVFSAEAEMMDREIISAHPNEVFDMVNDSFKDMVLRLENEAGPMVGIGIAVNFSEEKEWGMAVARVYMNTPAEIAGMQEGDKIIAINGKTFSSFGEFRQEIQSSSVPMRILRIDFIRDHTKMTVITKARILRGDRTNEAQALLEKVKKEGNSLLMRARAATDLVASNSDNKRFTMDADNAISDFWDWYFESYKAVDNLLSIE